MTGLEVATDVYREMMLYPSSRWLLLQKIGKCQMVSPAVALVYLNSGFRYNRYYNNQQYYNYSGYSQLRREISS